MSDLFESVDAPGVAPDGRLTDQQARAVSTRGPSVILSSGAGCGKTEVLTRRYLSHLAAEEAEIAQLVAITFTDRAAREMRKRIRGAIKKELSAAKKTADRERWERHLRNLETAAISTIHSFCASLLRQFAIRCGLDPRFEVLEDVLSSNLRGDALTGCLNDLLTAESPAGDDLRALVPLYGWFVTTKAVESLVWASDVASWDEWSARDPKEIADHWLTRDRDELKAEYVRHLLAMPKVSGCLALLKDTPCSGPRMQRNIARVLEETPKLVVAVDFNEAVRSLCKAAVVQGTELVRAWPDDGTYERVKESLGDFLRDTMRKRLDVFVDSPDNLEDTAAVGQQFIRVATACVRVYQAEKLAGVLDFQDLLSMARDMLRDRPALLFRVRHKFRFVLIDELQDTDPVQMDLVDLLCGGSTHGKLFAVGDAKQSIYRFRGADVGLFQSRREAVPVDGRQELSVNFRSQPRILDFVNALFGRHIPDYEPLSARRVQTNRGPCVEFLRSRREDRWSVQEGRREEANRIARRIAAIVGAGERLVVDRKTNELRPVGKGDVVLLFRSMSNVGLYEAALRKQGIDYYLVGGRAFFAQQEIYDLLNLLCALDNPQDAASLAGTLRSPFCCLNDETLFVLARHADGLWAGLHDDDLIAALPNGESMAANRARRFLDRWRAHKDRLPITGLINFVLADCGYDAALQFEFLGDRKLANLWKLIDLARMFDQSGMFGLADFVARLGELVKSQPREEQAATLPESADVVRLMSIHQAKGAEFPVVILPDLAAKPGGSILPAAVWDDRMGCVARPPTEDDPPLFSKCGWEIWKAKEELADWHEALRIAYVACTRAEDYLVLSAALPQAFSPENPLMTVLSEQFDLDTGECRDGSIASDRRPTIRVIGPDEVIKEGGKLRVERQPPPPLTAADAEAINPISD